MALAAQRSSLPRRSYHGQPGLPGASTILARVPILFPTDLVPAQARRRAGQKPAANTSLAPRPEALSVTRGSGKGKTSWAAIEQSIEVRVPVRTAYNRWTQFEEFPRFMEGVTEVRQLDDTHLPLARQRRR